jgi:UDP:flavonoid glycosyltransferase YjiC (YdhE family)
MRALFTTSGGLGNFNPLVPLADALRDRNHHVAFATPARFNPVVEAAGFVALPAGLDLTFREYREQILPLPPGTNEVAEVFVKGFARPMLADLLRIIPAWRPDLLIHDAVEFAAPTAGEILGLPHVAYNLVLFGYSPTLLDRLVRDDYAAFRQDQGLPPDPQYREYFRYLYLQHVPECVTPLPASIADRSQLIRPEFPAEGTPPPAWLAHLADLPTVYVTLGTVYNQTPGLIETILVALGRGEYNLIVTVGAERDPATFGPWPPPVHIAQYVPQAAVLSRCDAVVCHGGTGTLLGALAHGLPTLIIPLNADHFPSAARLSAFGAAEVLHAPDVSAESVRAAMHRLLATPGYRERSATIQADIAAMPSPTEVAHVLEARLPAWSEQASQAATSVTPGDARR